jgi:hypothetical protein
MALLRGLLSATPGACDTVFDPTVLPVFDVHYPGPFVWPDFTKFGSGGHPSAMSNKLQGRLAAEAIRKLLR